jgi:uncharacterized membrane protein
MTAPAAPAAARSVLGARFVVHLVLTMAIALGIVGAAVGPRRVALGLTHLPPMRLHAPQFGLVAQAPLAVQLHLFAVLLAFAIGVALLLGVKGRTTHRTLGWVWVVAMMTGAVSSLFIRIINHGSLSYIHLLAGWTIVALPMAVFAARTHRVKAHARFMTGLFTGGLILAGLLAFLPGRLMWEVWLG